MGQNAPPYWNKKRGGEGMPLVFFSWCKENLVIDKRTRATRRQASVVVLLVGGGTYNRGKK